MLEEIITKYENFSDSMILDFFFYQYDGYKIIEVTINCMNSMNNYEYEKIKIIFEDVKSFRFIENNKESSTVIYSAMLKRNKNTIIFDFFPLIFDDELKENEKSDFKIEFLRLNYEIL
jgi:hypothetical protein